MPALLTRHRIEQGGAGEESTIKRAHESKPIYEVEDDQGDATEISFRRAVDAEGFARIAHHLTLDLRISDGVYRTYALLLKYAQQKKKLFGGTERLAEERGLSRQAISGHLKELANLGLISRERRFGRTSVTIIEDVEQVYSPPPVVKSALQSDDTNVKETLPLSSSWLDDIIRIREEEKDRGESTDSPPTVPSPQKTPATSPTTREIQAAYQEVVGYPVDWKSGYAKAAKWLAQNGYSASDVIACYQHLKSQPFWADKPIHLSSIVKQIGEFMKAHPRAPDPSDGEYGYTPSGKLVKLQ